MATNKTTKTNTKVNTDKPGIITMTAKTHSVPGTPLTYQVSQSYIGKPATYVDQGTFDRHLEEFQGVARGAKLIAEEYKIEQEVAKAEQQRIKALTEETKVLEAAEGYYQAQTRVKIAQTKTAIEGVNLAEVQRDLAGRQSEQALRSETWDLKIEGIQADVAYARELLAQKRRTLSGN